MCCTGCVNCQIAAEIKHHEETTEETKDWEHGTLACLGDCGICKFIKNWYRLLDEVKLFFNRHRCQSLTHIFEEYEVRQVVKSAILVLVS